MKEYVRFGLDTVKKVIVFPVPSRDANNQTPLAGRVCLVTSRLGTRKTITFFYSVWISLYCNYFSMASTLK
jgi:hypothetical protein